MPPLLLRYGACVPPLLNSVWQGRRWFACLVRVAMLVTAVTGFVAGLRRGPMGSGKRVPSCWLKRWARLRWNVNGLLRCHGWRRRAVSAAFLPLLRLAEEPGLKAFVVTRRR